MKEQCLKPRQESFRKSTVNTENVVHELNMITDNHLYVTIGKSLIK